MHASRRRTLSLKYVKQASVYKLVPREHTIDVSPLLAAV